MKQYEINQDATLCLWPSQGVADSATFELQDAVEGSIVTESNATLGSAYATGSWSRGAETFTVSDYTHFTASKPYWVSTSVYGRGYEERCLDIDPNGSGLNATFTPAQKAKFTVTNGLIRDHGLYYTFAAASNTAVKRNCIAVWRYTIGEEDFTEYQSIDFVRKPFRISVTESDIERACATFGINGGDYNLYLAYIEQAKVDIYNFLRGQQIYPDLIIDKDLLKNAIIYRVLQFRLFDKLELADKYGQLYENTLAQFLTSKSWLAEDTNILGSSTELTLRKIPPKYMLIG